MVRKVIPVEQGLRHGSVTLQQMDRSLVRKVIPVEQGLRRKLIYFACFFYIVRKVIPVEQGLRPRLKQLLDEGMGIG